MQLVLIFNETLKLCKINFRHDSIDNLSVKEGKSLKVIDTFGKDVELNNTN